MEKPHVNGPRLFTLEEADDLIPFLEERLDRFFETLNSLEEARRELAVLRLVSASGGDEDNPDRRALLHLQSQAETLTADMNRIQREILWSGCVPKSYREGLIDFFALKEGRLVFLCWKRGEKRVSFWHTLDGGFQGRMPLRTFHDRPPEADLA